MALSFSSAEEEEEKEDGGGKREELNLLPLLSLPFVCARERRLRSVHWGLSYRGGAHVTRLSSVFLWVL